MLKFISRSNRVNTLKLPVNKTLPSRRVGFADEARTPQVSIGLPVYNGERFLAATIESILRQTFDDFELIISDNASTDRTGEISQAYAAKDQRVRYYRSEINLGASKNFNQVFELASGKYFKWSAHDDICACDFLSRCVEVLDRDSSVSLCYTRQIDINEHGEVIRANPYDLNTALTKPHERFAEVMKFWRGAPAIWGLMRADVLRTTPGIGNYYASDLVLLAELALRGRFYEVPEDLLFHRDHPSRSVYVSRPQVMVAWLDPTKSGRTGFPTWRWFFEYLFAVARVPMDLGEKLRCGLQAVKWLWWRWADACDDITCFAKNVLTPDQIRSKHH